MRNNFSENSENTRKQLSLARSRELAQSAITCSKLTTETLQQGVNFEHI